jgi:hypothetical protein
MILWINLIAAYLPVPPRHNAHGAARARTYIYDRGCRSDRVAQWQSARAAIHGGSLGWHPWGDRADVRWVTMWAG